jgi:hypothetical protein
VGGFEGKVGSLEDPGILGEGEKLYSVMKGFDQRLDGIRHPPTVQDRCLC